MFTVHYWYYLLNKWAGFSPMTQCWPWQLPYSHPPCQRPDRTVRGEQWPVSWSPGRDHLPWPSKTFCWLPVNHKNQFKQRHTQFINLNSNETYIYTCIFFCLFTTDKLQRAKYRYADLQQLTNCVHQCTCSCNYNLKASSYHCLNFIHICLLLTLKFCLISNL